MSRRLRGLVAVCVLAAGSLSAAPAHAATHEVTVRDNEFRARAIQIDPGDTVVWTASASGHTVTAENRRFDFHPGRTLDIGEQVSWTFHEEEDVRYLCRIHAGMEGLIRVGDPPVEPVPEGPTLTIPDDVATIAAATAAAAPGTEILIRPGTYRESVAVHTDGLVLRGLGAAPDEVVIDGAHQRDVGITISGARVGVANLRVQHHRQAGIRIEGATGTSLTDVSVARNDLYGIDAVGGAGTVLRAITATGHAIAGIAVRDCATCGARIDHATLERNAAGLLTSDATGLVVRGSHIAGNGVGIVLRDSAAVAITDSSLIDNAALDVPVASVFTAPPAATGAGVWISGGRGHRIHHNALTGHTYNIAVTGPLPVTDTRITHNTVGDAIHADIGWDVLGVDVCFTCNTQPDNTEPTSDPPAAQTVYDCALPTTIGTPYPVVTANLAGHGASRGIP